ncbi:MAG: hypothetical protein ACD_30C00092G0014 [uncultured bacterium]|uniref:DUF1648 domain-containing protein n=3 Tax=Candidatus Daviesiibacteriota TaxID=1752718 RepID=A0A0G0F929_9BACT|nr:MAG: hypothetical protein ACD_30C00092G0014 [uncultured bacterium]KKQ10030.1 MAG: hypothetical protein US19_C0009G0032 [Candidatus Daviesbacteria bacterium GW2011_GWB1_36_5]KKQ15917.1 MAG: hypothetical protein US28_C0007G0008 [Candidatus Daviesbacteria bacterium GW2011_GWA1_36_8]OGE30792.1 MAG: hypothetical protein A3C99_00615 [Candidatus Daviesbacteria bacterium RIFCSPHIGHO2_02_FULL_37_9]OGE35184.1 MAG: hypothetical protein A3E66_02005 [Candidatus Daviesbacteria bacterium RIFCSPHIGHO2_12_FU
MPSLLKKFSNFYNSQDKYSFISITLILSMALLILLTWVISYPYLPSQLPLFYSLSWGTSQLATLTQFLILVSIMILIMLINSIVSWHLHPSQILLKRILSITTTVTSFLILLTSLKIIFTFI